MSTVKTTIVCPHNGMLADVTAEYPREICANVARWVTDTIGERFPQCANLAEARELVNSYGYSLQHEIVGE